MSRSFSTSWSYYRSSGKQLNGSALKQNKKRKREKKEKSKRLGVRIFLVLYYKPLKDFKEKQKKAP